MCRDELEIHAVLHYKPVAGAVDGEGPRDQGGAEGSRSGARGWGVDSFGFELEVLEETCRELGVALLVVPFDVASTQNHQILLEWVSHKREWCEDGRKG